MDESAPFWVRWGTRPVMAWLLGAAALADLTWTITATAQHAAVLAARPTTADLFLYSRAGHVAGMTLLGCAAVLVASALVQRRRRWMAVSVLAGTAAGSMTVIAAPLRWSLVAPSSMDTVWWWHLAVAAAAFAILLAWTLAAAGRDRASDALDERRGAPSDDVVFVLVAATAFVGCWNFAWHLQESPGVLPAMGWAVLVAGAVVVSSRASWRLVALLLPLLAVTLRVLQWAYLRDGGWPGVGGWEFNGMESPVILSSRVTVVIVAGPLLGLALRGFRCLQESAPVRRVLGT